MRLVGLVIVPLTLLSCASTVTSKSNTGDRRERNHVVDSSPAPKPEFYPAIVPPAADDPPDNDWAIPEQSLAGENEHVASEDTLAKVAGSPEGVWLLPLAPNGTNCTPAKTSEYDISPETLMREHPGCHLKAPEDILGLSYLDCGDESIPPGVLFYIRSKQACEEYLNSTDQEEHKWLQVPGVEQKPYCIPAVSFMSPKMIMKIFPKCRKTEVGEILTLDCTKTKMKSGLMFVKTVSACKRVMGRMKKLESKRDE